MKRSPLIILFITLFIDLLGFGLILPNIPIYIQHYGGTSAIGGLLMACFSVAQFIFAPLWGSASDRYGRRPIILIGLIGSAFSYFCFGAAQSLTVLFVARIASGALTAASLPTAQAYIADVTTPEKRAGGMAMLGAAFGLGFAFGPWLGGLLGAHSIFGQPPLATPAYFASALALVNFLWAFFALPESHLDRTQRKAKGFQEALDVFPAIVRAMKHPAFSASLLVFAFATFAFTAVESSFSWLVLLRFDHALRDLTAQAWQAHSAVMFSALPAIEQKHLVEKTTTGVNGTIFGIVGVTILIVQGAVMGGLARRIGEHRLVRFGAFVLICALIGLAFAPSLNTIKLLSVFIALGNGVMSPSLSAIITHSAGPSERGLVSGAQQGLGSLARIVAPPVNNYLVGVNTAIPFLASSVLMTITFFLSLTLRPLVHTPPPTEGEPEAVPAAVGH